MDDPTHAAHGAELGVSVGRRNPPAVHGWLQVCSVTLQEMGLEETLKDSNVLSTNSTEPTRRDGEGRINIFCAEVLMEKDLCIQHLCDC